MPLLPNASQTIANFTSAAQRDDTSAWGCFNRSLGVLQATPTGYQVVGKTKVAAHSIQSLGIDKTHVLGFNDAMVGCFRFTGSGFDNIWEVQKQRGEALTPPVLFQGQVYFIGSQPKLVPNLYQVDPKTGVVQKRPLNLPMDPACPNPSLSWNTLLASHKHLFIRSTSGHYVGNGVLRRVDNLASPTLDYTVIPDPAKNPVERFGAYVSYIDPDEKFCIHTGESYTVGSDMKGKILYQCDAHHAKPICDAKTGTAIAATWSGVYAMNAHQVTQLNKDHLEGPIWVGPNMLGWSRNVVNTYALQPEHLLQPKPTVSKSISFLDL